MRGSDQKDYEFKFSMETRVVMIMRGSRQKGPKSIMIMSRRSTSSLPNPGQGSDRDSSASVIYGVHFATISVGNDSAVFKFILVN
jgi:hypothetical protein